MRSCDVHHLQFESYYNEALRTYLVKRGTERLVCPKCHFEHTEDMKRKMIIEGRYVHIVPELLRDRPSFQIGALASQLQSLSWSEIAAAQLEAGKSADIEIQQNFDNSWRGLPFKPRAISKDEIETLRQRHAWHTPPSLETAEMVFVTADVMDDFCSYGVFVWDVHDSLYLIECGEVPYIELTEEKRSQVDEQLKQEGKPPVKTLEDILYADYLVQDGVGIAPTFLVIDQGGHRAEEVKHFAKMNKTVLMQKRHDNDLTDMAHKRQSI